MKDIAKRIPGKSTEQCQNRWFHHLNTEHVSFIQILFFHFVSISLLLFCKFLFLGRKSEKSSILYIFNVCLNNDYSFNLGAFGATKE